MQTTLSNIEEHGRFSIKYFLLGIILIIPLIFLLNNSGFNLRTVVIVLGIPVVTMLLFCYRAYKYFFIISLFTNYYLFGLYFSVFVGLGLLFSFLLTYRGVNSDFFKTPLTLPAIIYYGTVIPSLINSSNVLLSIYIMLNLHAMVILFLIFGYTVNDYKKIKNIIYAFIALTTIDAFVIIFLALTLGGRKFGISGVVYVDYSAMAIITLFLYMLFNKKNITRNNTVVIAALVMVILAGLIFTQTRNTFISLSLTFLALFIFITIKRSKFNISTGKLVGVFTSIIVVSLILVVILTYVNPDVFQRLDQLNKSNVLTVKKESDFSSNTLLSRLLIWDTAWNAFKAHPIVGIGVYSFPFESATFSTIPKDLYKEFVAGLSPHITFLANLAETGIIGFVGFLIFLGSSLWMGIKSVNLAFSEEQIFYSIIILALQFYILFSMFLTDAWLWGQCGMLWGVVLGLSIANYKIITQKNKSQLNVAK